MVNSNKLLGRVREAGMTCKTVAELSGMAPNTFSIKANNGREFSASEIMKISKILKLSMEEVGQIFFAEDVEC